MEESSFFVRNEALKIGCPPYASNWCVTECRYDVLLGMPWHVANSHRTDYERRIVRVDSDKIPLEHATDHMISKVKVTNLGVEKFRRMLRKGISAGFKII